MRFGRVAIGAFLLPIQGVLSDYVYPYGDRLQTGQTLTIGQGLMSMMQKYILVLQSDNNVCIYQNNGSQRPTWCAAKAMNQWVTGSLVMQPDGNLVLYDNTGVWRWQSGTNSGTTTNDYYVVVQDDGQLVLHTVGGKHLLPSAALSGPSPVSSS